MIEKIYIPQEKETWFTRLFEKHPFLIFFGGLFGFVGLALFITIYFTFLLAWYFPILGFLVQVNTVLLILFLAAIFMKFIFHFVNGYAYAFIQRDGIWYVVSSVQSGTPLGNVDLSAKSDRYSKILDEILDAISSDPSEYEVKPNKDRNYFDRLTKSSLENAGMIDVCTRKGHVYPFLKLNNPEIIKYRFGNFRIRFQNEEGEDCDATFTNHYDGLFDALSGKNGFQNL